MGRNEPFWQNNSSFSPPLSRRWDHQFRSEGQSFGSQGDSRDPLFGSSLSSNSKESRSWVRGEQLPNHNYSASDGVVSYPSSPDNSFQSQQFTPPLVQGVNADEYVSAPIRETASKSPPFPQFLEGTSEMPYSVSSTSSPSDGSEYELTSKTRVPSHRNFTNRCSFMSKPIHPLSFPDQTVDGEEARGSVATTNSYNSLHSELKSIQALTEIQSLSGFLEMGGTSQREVRWSSASSIEFTDISEPLEPDPLVFSYNSLYGGSKCGLCERFLSQRSPWSSRRIVRSGDMPIAGVLSCWHVYHAECLERTTPKTQKHDPPCPICEKSVENAAEQWAVCRLKNGLPRLRPLGEEGPSRVWSCGQAGDCVEGALHAPTRNSILFLNRSRLKRHLSLKGNSGKEPAEKSKKSAQAFHARILGDQAAVGCSKMSAGPALKRW